MSVQHDKSGDVINLLQGNALAAPKTMTLLKSDDLEVVRLIIPARAEVQNPRLRGELTVQCLKGRVAFTTETACQELEAGQMLYLAESVAHSVKGIEDSSVLLTIHSALTKERNEFDLVDEASEESFPASDPPPGSRSSDLNAKSPKSPAATRRATGQKLDNGDQNGDVLVSRPLRGQVTGNPIAFRVDRRC